MKKLLLIPLLLLSLNACATLSGKPEAPAVTSGKSLLAIKETIITVRDGFGVPCQQGLVSATDCKNIDALYQKAKPIYDSAVDAEMLALTSGNTADVQTYQAALLSLATDMATLAAKYGVKGASK